MKKHALPIAVILAIIIGILFLQRFFIVIALAAIAAFTFFPVYRLLRRWTKNDVLASWLTALVSIVAVIIPVLLIIYATVHELQQAMSGVINYLSTHDPGDIVESALVETNRFLANLTNGNASLSIDQIKEAAQTAASYVASNASSWAGSIFGGVSSFITMSIIYLYVFSAFLVNHKRLVAYIRALNPLGDEVSDLYLSRTAAMTKAMVRGQFIIAAIQGIVSAGLLYIAGLDYFWLAAILLTFLSIIPLGSGIIVIPIGVVLLLMGNIWQGLLLILGHILIISNIDNILRPMLVPKTARLNPALVLLAVFAGLGFFGLLGIVIGPVLMILLVTTIDVYAEATGKLKAIDPEKDKELRKSKKQRKPNLLQRLGIRKKGKN